MKTKNLFQKILLILLILSLNSYLLLLNPKSVNAQAACREAVTPNPDTSVCELPADTGRFCDIGFTPRVTKTQVGIGIICACVCEAIGTPAPGPGVPAPTPQPGQPAPNPNPVLPTPGGTADESQIQKWATNILYGMIIFGFLYAIIMAPYIGYLFALATPDSIKKGRELMMALIYGLLLLALSTSIVGIVGTDILQV